MAVRAALVEPTPRNRKPIVSLDHGDQLKLIKLLEHSPKTVAESRCFRLSLLPFVLRIFSMFSWMLNDGGVPIS